MPGDVHNISATDFWKNSQLPPPLVVAINTDILGKAKYNINKTLFHSYLLNNFTARFYF